MKNKLIDLNNHLFMQLERLSDEDLKGDALETEIKRARSISTVATKVIDNASIILDAQKLQVEYDRTPFKPQTLLGQVTNDQGGSRSERN